MLPCSMTGISTGGAVARSRSRAAVPPEANQSETSPCACRPGRTTSRADNPAVVNCSTTLAAWRRPGTSWSGTTYTCVGAKATRAAVSSARHFPAPPQLVVAANP